MKHNYVLILFGLGALFLVLLYRLESLPFLGSDEPRYARIAEEMNTGGDWVTPTLNHRPWLEKPPLLFWVEATSFRLFGVSEWAARLPSVLFALLGIGATTLLAYSWRGLRCALYALLILPTSSLYALYGRAASTDMLLAVGFTLAMVSAKLALRSGSLCWACVAGLAAALAVLAKGPVVLILIGAVFIVYFLVGKSSFWKPSQVMLATAVFMVVGVPWFILAWKANGSNFLISFWLNHHLARFITDLHHHYQPLWYYLPVILVGFFPWVFFLGSSALSLWRRRRRLTSPRIRVELFCWLWAVIPLLFFTFSASKLAGYVLPVFPALAVLAAGEWDRFVEGDLSRYASFKVQLALAASFGLVLSLTILVGFHLVYGAAWVGALVAFPLAACSILARNEFRKRRSERLFFGLVSSMVLALALLYWQGSSIVGQFHSARDLCLLARPYISEEKPLVLYRYFHHTARYYTNYETTPEAIDSLEQLQGYIEKHPQERYLLLMKKNGWAELRDLPVCRLSSHVGNLYLVELDNKGDQLEKLLSRAPGGGGEELPIAPRNSRSERRF